ncbi:MAG: hypothetical protein AAF098_05165 [Pseudomonadota bacterium]
MLKLIALRIHAYALILLSSIFPCVEATTAELGEELGSGIAELFLQLVSRDGHLNEFAVAENKLGVACVDWEANRFVRRADLLSIERYWIYYDEGTMDEMRQAALADCISSDAADSCECVSIIENDQIVVQPPDDVLRRRRLARFAFEVVNSEEARHLLRPLDFDQSNVQLLSKENEGNNPYGEIERIQALVCLEEDGQINARCLVTQSSCANEVTSMPKLFEENTESEDAEIARLACMKNSTEYELPGVHMMLSSYFDLLRVAAKIQEIEILDRFAFGSLPTPEINVSINSDPAYGHRLVFFNQSFFMFVYEMAKAAALALPREMDDAGMELSPSDSAFEEYIEANPELIDLFRRTVETFIGGEMREAIQPPREIMPFLVVFGFGAEKFAMAHEMGHSILRHGTGESMSLEDAGVCEPATGGNWLEEIKADYIGLRLIEGAAAASQACSGATLDSDGGLSVFGGPLEHCASHPLEIGLALAPVFYFTAVEVKNLACGAGSKNSSGSSMAEDEFDDQIIEFANHCASDPKCDFLEAVDNALPKGAQEKIGHPSPFLRRGLVEVWIQNRALVAREDNVISGMSYRLVQNARALADKAYNADRNRATRSNE